MCLECYSNGKFGLIWNLILSVANVVDENFIFCSGCVKVLCSRVSNCNWHVCQNVHALTDRLKLSCNTRMYVCMSMDVGRRMYAGCVKLLTMRFVCTAKFSIGNNLENKPLHMIIIYVITA